MLDTQTAKDILAKQEAYSLAEALVIIRESGLILTMSPAQVRCEWWPHPMCYGTDKIKAEFYFNPSDRSVDEVEAGVNSVLTRLLDMYIRMMGG